MIKNEKNKNKLLLIDILLDYTKVIKYSCDEIGKKDIFLVLQFCQVSFGNCV